MITTGPYRYLKHPNYVVVAAEIATLPLVFGLAWYALAFSILNAGVLYVRINAENTALEGQPISRTDTDKVSARGWAGFSMMCLGMFMAILDIQVVATSLPTIQGALHIAPDQMSWIQTAYLVAEIIAIPLTGFLIRAATMRLLFTVATVVFTLASIGCAFSPAFKILSSRSGSCRASPGGTLIPTVFSAVFLMFPMRLQTIAATIAGVLAVLGPTIGPVVGG